MTEKLIPLFLAGFLHIWNPEFGNGYLTREASFQTIGQYEEVASVSTVAGKSEAVTDWTGKLRIWIDVQGTAFEALVPKNSWKASGGTGRAVLITTKEETSLTFYLVTPTVTYTGNRVIPEKTSLGMFTSEIGPGPGTLFIGGNKPFTIHAVNCQSICAVIPAVVVEP
jgi:hypothetical protein